MSPAMIAFVVAIAGMILPAIAKMVLVREDIVRKHIVCNP
jgi:hypothetical protein